MEFIILLILLAGAVSWIADNSKTVFKWFLFILFAPFTVPIVVISFIAGIILEIKNRKKSPVA